MPELPEVETIVRQLQKQIKGKKIGHVRIRVPKLVHGSIPQSLITDVRRRAKAIVIKLGSKQYIIIRLGMTGHFHYAKGKKQQKEKGLEPQEQKYIVVQFFLNDGSILSFNDIRKFGSVQVLSSEKAQTLLKKMGPEPLSSGFTLPAFRTLLQQKRNAHVKVALLDQHFIAGIGNIYAQEILYRAGIDPRRKIVSLSDTEIRKLHKAMKNTLNQAIRHHGTTVQDYVHIEGSGGFQRYLQVYGREKCPQKHPLTKIYLGSRGTYFCPKCQKS